MNFTIKRNDDGFVIAYTLVNQDNTNPNLTGATVMFNVGNDTSLLINKAATIVDAVSGKVSYTMTDQDSLYDGLYKAEFSVTMADGSKITYPRMGYITLNIQKNVDVTATSLIVDEIAKTQGDYEAKLTNILSLKNITASYMNEYTWTTTAGKLTYTVTDGSVLDVNSQWLEVELGNVPVSPSLLDRSVNNQITLLIDSSSVFDGMTLVARWASPLSPISFATPVQSVASTTSLPTPSLNNQFTMWAVKGSAGVADAIYICKKLSNDTYNWVQLA